MITDRDIAQFVAVIGATEPSQEDEHYAWWKALFKRSNYFSFNGKFMIVKISRIKKPFWGVRKELVDLFNSFNSQDEYYLVFLVSPRVGWVFTKSEVNAHIRSKRWKLAKDNNYKIHVPLPESNSFFSPRNFLKKVGLSEEGTAT